MRALRTPHAGPPLRIARSRLTRRLLVGADALAAVALLAAVTGGVRAGTLLVAALVVLAAVLQGLYDRDELLLRPLALGEVRQVVAVTTLAALAGRLGEDAVAGGALGGWATPVLWAGLTLAMVGARPAARSLAGRLCAPERVLLAGDARAHERLVAGLGEAGATLAGRMDARRESLADAIDRVRPDRVVIDTRALPGAELHDLVRAANHAGLAVSLLKRELDAVGPEVEFDDLGGLVLIGVRR